MTQQTNEQAQDPVGKPYFSIAATICNLVSLPVAMAAIKLLNPEQDYFGYSGLAIAMVTLLAFLLVGFALGGMGIIKKEQPPAFPLMLTLINGVILAFAALRLLA